MDQNVPAGARVLLDFIGATETGKTGPAGYDVIYGHKQGKLAKPLTSMTLDEVQAAQRNWSRHHGSSAAGRYQFMRATLKDLMAELRLSGSQKFDAELQDRLGYHLLKRRGYLEFAAGRIGVTEFGRRLAMEWASLPVLSPTQGAHRKVAAGETYYAGDKLNKALVAPSKVEAVLYEAHAANKAASRPSPANPPNARPEPPEAPRGRAGWIALAIVVVGSVITAAGQWLLSLFT